MTSHQILYRQMVKAMSQRALRELSRHAVGKPIDADQTVICSPHELIAVVTHTHDVVVYRLNGQIAFTIKNPHDDDVEDEDLVKVARAGWSPDGRRIAVAWSDGSWRIHEAEKGGSVFESTVRLEKELSNTVVLGMSWQRHVIQTQGKAPSDHQGTGLPADYPREINLFDVTGVLPRLSALPAHGLRMSIEGAKFAQQSSMDSIFASLASHGEDGTVEVLLLHASDNSIRVMLNGTSHVGTAKMLTPMENARYASTALSASHVLLAHAESSSLQLELLDLPLDELNGGALHLISHSAMQLNSLIQYVRRVAQCIDHDYTLGVALPARLINSISIDLENHQESCATLPSALIHLAMTGQFHEALPEWLTDIVKDTGLKRWDTSISTMYSSIQMHLHSHVLPAVDRMTIAASALRGLARLHQSSAAFTSDEKLFSAILDKANALRHTALHGLEICMSEWSSWRMFSKWLKMQIEVASAGPSTKEAAETEEREGLGIDTVTVIQYIQTVMQNGGRLQGCIKGTADTDIKTLTAAIDAAIGVALDSVTAWQGRLFTSTRTTALEYDGEKVSDILLLPPAGLDGASSIATATVSEQNDIVSLSSYLIPEKGNYAETPGTIPTTLVRPLRAKVFEAKLYRSGQKLLFLEQSRPAKNLPFDGLQLTSFDMNTKEADVMHHFSNKSHAKPEHILVGGREGKEFCVVIGQGHQSWTVLDLHADRTAYRLKDS